MKISAKADYAVRAAIELAGSQREVAGRGADPHATDPYAAVAHAAIAHAAIAQAVDAHVPRHVKAESIAHAQDIPRHFLDNILGELRVAGLVRTQRGPDGGSSLARPASTITVADVLRAVEGPLAAVRGERPESLDYAGNAEPFRDVWIAVRASLRAVLEHVTLADLAAGQLPRPVADLTAVPDAWLPH